LPPPNPAPHINRLRPYIPGKPIEEVQREYGLTDIVKLASNENPFGPSPRALEAAARALQGIALYPEASCPELVQALASHLQVPVEWLAVGNGSDELIHYLGLTYLREGDELLTGDPSFVRYEAAAILNRAEFIATPLRDHTFDLEAMAERVGPRTRLVFIANPNNPTGTMVGGAAVRRFLDHIPSTALVVMDEAYHEYVDDPEYPHSLDLLRAGYNLVILRTFSKIYALAGLRVGYAIAHPDVIRAVHQVREPFNVNSVAQAAALASLEDPDQVRRSREANRAGLHYLYRQFERLGLACVPSQANFVLVDVGRPARAVFEALLRRGVIVRTMELYGMPTYLRVTVGRPEDNARFIADLEAVLAAPAPE
jgi:histidinol-phosphate aminotransferase